MSNIIHPSSHDEMNPNQSDVYAYGHDSLVLRPEYSKPNMVTNTNNTNNTTVVVVQAGHAPRRFYRRPLTPQEWESTARFQTIVALIIASATIVPLSCAIPAYFMAYKRKDQNEPIDVLAMRNARNLATLAFFFGFVAIFVIIVIVATYCSGSWLRSSSFSSCSSSSSSSNNYFDTSLPVSMSSGVNSGLSQNSLFNSIMSSSALAGRCSMECGLYEKSCASTAHSCEATDYPGGWVLPDKKQCVNICEQPPPSNGKNQPGDWDYSLVEQMYLPQYCRELDRGVDITYSHQNVLPFPAGIQCSPDRVPSNFSIHGLWFDYFDGYPACCNYTSSNENVPYDPLALLNNYPSLLQVMNVNWTDPAVSPHDSLCVLYNHEFQKHGACYSGAFTNEPLEAAYIYFNDALEVTGRVQKSTLQLNVLAHRQIPVPVVQIQQLYARKVQILCSNTQPPNQLAAIHTCWAKTEQKTVGEQIDCPPATESPLFVPCDETGVVTLEQYVPPDYAIV